MRLKNVYAMIVGFLLVMFAAQAPLTAQDKPYVVLALSGGGVKGYAHIGVLAELEKAGIGVAGIVGTSMGAIVGSVYASGKSVEELERIVSNVNLGELVTARGDHYFGLSEKARRDISIVRPEIHTDRNDRPVGPLGFVAGNSVLEYFAHLLEDVNVSDFMKLPTPFAAVATDLVSGEKVVLRKGSLPSAVRASMSIPGVFDPWEIDGRLLVDGGMVSNMPVETARELFPGYPVVAVNLTSELEPRANIVSVVDVLSQSITILTIQNVRREAKLADLVIDPKVKEYSMLGSAPAGEIIAQGRRAARAMMPKLKELAKKAPRRPIHLRRRLEIPLEKEPLVESVTVTGMPDEMAADMVLRLERRWRGRALDVPGVIAASTEIAKREDVRSVDYDILPLPDRDGKPRVGVLMKVQRFPANRYTFSAFGDTLSGMGRVKLNVKSYDKFRPGDILLSDFYVGKNWAADFNYFWGDTVNHSAYWEGGISAIKFRMDPWGGPALEWQQYITDLRRHFTLNDRLRLSAGVKFSAIRRTEGGHNMNYWAPFSDVIWNMMDDPDDGRRGFIFKASTSWPSEARSVLLRTSVSARQLFGKKTVAEFKGGFADGDMTNRLFSAYLGSYDELYTLVEHPVESERYLWWRASLRRPLTTTMFGSVDGEIFGAHGYAWDDDSTKIADIWEAGLAVTFPPKLMEGRVFAAYTSHRKEWKFGVRVGIPDWEVFHLF